MFRLSRRECLLAAGGGMVFGLARPSGAAEDPEEDVVTVPAGRFLMGTRPEDAERLARKHGYHLSWLAGETPQREIDLPAFRIDRYPVTNRRYAAFCRATGHRPRPHWGGPEPPAQLLDHPVVFVNKADAEACARWAGKRLPTEAEWEKAARGSDGRLFPWGNEFDPEACCWNRAAAGRGIHTAPVTAHPRGASPYGVMEMAGNVAEWCADGPSPPAAFIKGGCWMTGEVIHLRPAGRLMSGFANNASSFYGFRCAKEV